MFTLSPPKKNKNELGFAGTLFLIVSFILREPNDIGSCYHFSALCNTNNF